MDDVLPGVCRGYWHYFLVNGDEYWGVLEWDKCVCGGMMKGEGNIHCPAITKWLVIEGEPYVQNSSN